MAYGLETISSVMGGYGFDTSQIVSREQVPNVTSLTDNGVLSQSRYGAYRVWMSVGDFSETASVIGMLNKPVDLAFGSTYASLVDISGTDGLGALVQAMGAGSARYKFTTARFWKSSKPLTITLDMTVTEDDYTASPVGTEVSVGKIINFINKLGQITLPSEHVVGEDSINFTGMTPPGPEPYSLDGWIGSIAKKVGSFIKGDGGTITGGSAKRTGARIMVKVMDFLFFDWMQVESVNVEFSPAFVDYSKQISSFSDTLKSWIASSVSKDVTNVGSSASDEQKEFEKDVESAGYKDKNGNIHITRPYYAKFKIQLSTLYDLTRQDLNKIITFNEGNRLSTSLS